MLVGERREQPFILQRSLVQRLLFLFGKRVGCVAAQEFADVFVRHSRVSQWPPMSSRSCFRHRASHVYTVLMEAAPISFWISAKLRPSSFNRKISRQRDPILPMAPLILSIISFRST